LINAVEVATNRSKELGQNSGGWGVFVAVEGIKDDGFRDFSEAEIKRMYADWGVKGDGKEFHLNFSGAKNFVGVTAAAPEDLLDLGWERTYTSPQTTDNEMKMLSLNGSVKVTPSLTLSGVTYYRWFQQEHDDGNIARPGVRGAGLEQALLRGGGARATRSPPSGRAELDYRF
jgi:hypothetical protein